MKFRWLVALLLTCAPAKAQTPAPTYAAMQGLTAPYATPQDLACITGASNKLIRVLHMVITAQATSGNAEAVFTIIKRSTLNSGGTTTALTSVSYDDRNPPAAASVMLYTAAPTTPGTLVGNVRGLAVPLTATNGSPSPIDLLSGMFPINDFTAQQPVTLTSTEELCFNFGGVAVPSGGQFGYGFEWTER